MSDCNGCYLDKLHETEEEKLRCLHRETCERAYQQGRADAIEEFARLIHEDLYQLNHHQVDFLAEQLKEQK